LILSSVTITESHNGTLKDGGGIFNSGDLLVIHSTISDNSAGGTGGGIYNTGTLRVIETNISGNGTAIGRGGRNFQQRDGVNRRQHHRQ
jgi:predicted outer membrane repeat protein